LRERRTLAAVAVLVVLSLVPATMIYWLFGALSSANVAWASDKVKLGGPIAAFFAILLLLYRMYSRLMTTESRDSDLAQPFVGRWRATSHSNVSGRDATSDIDAVLTGDGMLALSGNFRDQDGKDIGDWDSKEVFCTPSRVAFRYVITDKGAAEDNTNIAFCTLRIAARNKSGRPTRLSGTWDVIGPRHHDGTIELERADE
jgi:hypothetical protein